MVKIGDKQVVFQVSLVVPDKEIAAFDTPEIKIEIQFHPEDKSDNRVSWRTANGILHMDFNGMDNPLGLAPTNPFRLGLSANGEALGFLFFHHRAGNMNRVDFLLLKGGQYVK